MTRAEALRHAEVLEIAAQDLRVTGRYLVGDEAIDSIEASATLLRDLAWAKTRAWIVHAGPTTSIALEPPKFGTQIRLIEDPFTEGE